MIDLTSLHEVIASHPAVVAAAADLERIADDEARYLTNRAEAEARYEREVEKWADQGQLGPRPTPPTFSSSASFTYQRQEVSARIRAAMTEHFGEIEDALVETEAELLQQARELRTQLLDVADQLNAVVEAASSHRDRCRGSGAGASLRGRIDAAALLAGVPVSFIRGTAPTTSDLGLLTSAS